MEFLSKFSTKEQAEQEVFRCFQAKELIMGFGHRVYKNGDPRNQIIKACSKRLSEQSFGNPNLFAISDHVEQLVLTEKKMHANLDFFAASAYH